MYYAKRAPDHDNTRQAEVELAPLMTIDRFGSFTLPQQQQRGRGVWRRGPSLCEKTVRVAMCLLVALSLLSSHLQAGSGDGSLLTLASAAQAGASDTHEDLAARELASQHTFRHHPMSLFLHEDGTVSAHDIADGRHLWSADTGGAVVQMQYDQLPTERTLRSDPLALPLVVRGNALYTRGPLFSPSADADVEEAEEGQGGEKREPLGRNDSKDGGNDHAEVMFDVDGSPLYFFAHVSTLVRRQAMVVNGVDIFVTSTADITDLDSYSGRQLLSRSSTRPGMLREETRVGGNRGRREGALRSDVQLQNPLLPTLHVVRYDISIHAYKPGAYGWTLTLAQFRLSERSPSRAREKGQEEQSPRFFSHVVREMADFEHDNGGGDGDGEHADKLKRAIAKPFDTSTASASATCPISPAITVVRDSKLDVHKAVAQNFVFREVNDTHVALYSLRDQVELWITAVGRGGRRAGPHPSFNGNNSCRVVAGYVWLTNMGTLLPPHQTAAATAKRGSVFHFPNAHARGPVVRLPVLRGRGDAAAAQLASVADAARKQDAHGAPSSGDGARGKPTQSASLSLHHTTKAGGKSLSLVQRSQPGNLVPLHNVQDELWLADMDAEEDEGDELQNYYTAQSRSQWWDPAAAMLGLRYYTSEDDDGPHLILVERSKTWHSFVMAGMHCACLALSIAFLCAGVPQRDRLQRAWAQADRSRDFRSVLTSGGGSGGGGAITASGLRALAGNSGLVASRPNSAILMPRDLIARESASFARRSRTAVAATASEGHNEDSEARFLLEERIKRHRANAGALPSSQKVSPSAPPQPSPWRGPLISHTPHSSGSMPAAATGAVPPHLELTPGSLAPQHPPPALPSEGNSALPAPSAMLISPLGPGIASWTEALRGGTEDAAAIHSTAGQERTDVSEVVASSSIWKKASWKRSTKEPEMAEATSWRRPGVATTGAGAGVPEATSVLSLASRVDESVDQSRLVTVPADQAGKAEKSPESAQLGGQQWWLRRHSDYEGDEEEEDSTSDATSGSGGSSISTSEEESTLGDGPHRSSRRRQSRGKRHTRRVGSANSSVSARNSSEGHIFQEHFKIIRKVGFGAEGSVFCVEHRWMHNQFAIKVIHIHSQEQDKVVQEAVLHSSFDHPNVVRFFFCWVEEVSASVVEHLQLLDNDDGMDVMSLSYQSDEGSAADDRDLTHTESFGSVGTGDDSVRRSRRSLSRYPQPETYRMLFIQMEYFPTGTLADELSNRPRVNRLRNLRHLLDIAQGLLYLHTTQNVVHRDLKPTNIFVTADGVMKIGDFGLAKRRGPAANLNTSLHPIGAVTAAAAAAAATSGGGSAMDLSSNVLGNQQEQSVIGGSPLYCSPEQMRGDVTNKPTDIFSLGIIAVEMYCCFTTMHERIRVLTDARELRLPEEITESFPEEAELLQQMLNASPLKRPATRKVVKTVRNMLDDLEADGEQEEVEEPGSPTGNSTTTIATAAAGGGGVRGRLPPVDSSAGTTAFPSTATMADGTEKVSSVADMYRSSHPSPEPNGSADFDLPPIAQAAMEEEERQQTPPPRKQRRESTPAAERAVVTADTTRHEKDSKHEDQRGDGQPRFSTAAQAVGTAAAAVVASALSVEDDQP